MSQMERIGSSDWTIGASPASEGRRERPRLTAFLIALAYGVVAVAWILGSDRALNALGVSDAAAKQIEVGKGVVWVVLTAVLLYVLIARPLVRVVRMRERADRARGEAQARARELETVLDAVPVAVWIARDPECRVIEGNRVGRELLGGVGQNEKVNLSLSAPSGVRPTGFEVRVDGQVAKPDDLPVQRAARTGVEVRDFEEEIVYEDGRRLKMLGSAVPLRSPSGELQGAVGAFLDVTARDRALDALHRNQLILEQAQELGQIGSWVSDPAHHGGFLTWSRETYRIFGLKEGEFDGRVDSFFALVHPDDREAVRTASLEAIAGRSEYAIDHRIIRPDGAVRWVHERARIDRNEAGEAIRMIGVCQDITDRMEADAKLRASEAQLRTALDAASMICWETDSTTGITTYSQDPVGFFGLSAPSLAPTGGLDIVHPDAREEVLQAFNEVLSGTGEFVESSFRSAASPDERWFRAVARIQRDGEGRPLSVIGVTREITAERETAERVRRSESRYRMIVETCHEGVWLADAEWKTTFVNQQLATMLGRTPDEMIGRNVLDFVVPEDRDRMRPRLRDRQSGVSGVYENRLLRADGRTLWVTMAASPVRDDAGGFAGALAMVTDITDRKQMEESLRASELRFRELFDALPDPAWDWDVIADRTTHSATWPQLLGHSPGDPSIGTWETLLHPEDRPGVLARLEACVAGQCDLYEAEYRIRAKDGSYKWVLSRGRVVERTPDGRAKRMIGGVTDMTERRRAEDDLRLSEARYRVLVESAPEAIVVYDIEKGRFAECNAQSAELFRMPLEELMNKGPVELSPERQPDGRLSSDAAQEYLRRAIAGERPTFEWVHVASDGLEVPCEIRLARMPDRERVLIRGSITDITERKRAQDALRASEEKYRLVLKATSDAMWDYEPASGILKWGDNIEGMFGFSINEMGEGLDGWTSRLHPEDRNRAEASFKRALANGDERWSEEYRFRKADGTYAMVLDRAYMLRRPDGTLVRIIGAMTDVTEQHHNAKLMAGQALTLELLVGGAELQRVLEEIVRILEDLEPGCLGSVLLLDEDGRTMRPAAAPSLPPEYSRLLDGIAIGPGAGSCGTAMYERRRVIVADIENDPLWAPYKAIALPHGLRACWSEPIIGAGGKVLGSLAMYYRTTRGPGHSELRSIAWAARLAGLAIERRQAEDELMHRETELRDILNAIPDLMFRMDREGRYLDFHAPNKDDLIVPPEKFMGRRARDVLPKELGDLCMTHVERVIRTGEPQMYEYQIHGKRGQRYWEVRVTQCAQEQVLLLVRDITVRRTAERRLQESEQRLSLLVRQSPLGVIVWDLNWCVAEWNAAAEQMFGWSAPEALGRHADFILPDSVKPQVAEVWKSLKENRGGWRNTNANVTREGKAIVCEWYNAPLIDADGRVFAIASIVEDVTEQRQAQQRQQLMMAELDHRVKNNLAAVISLAEQSGRTTTTFADFRTSFLGRVRALSRLHNALAATRWQGANLGRMVQQTLEAFGQDATAQAVVEGPGVVLPARAAQAMGMALNELCTNAIKYGALSVPGGRVEVRWQLRPPEGDMNRPPDLGPPRPILELRWSECGGPIVSQPTRRGFGTELIEGAISYELGGSATLRFAPEGLECTIRIEVPSDAEYDARDVQRD